MKSLQRFAGILTAFCLMIILFSPQWKPSFTGLPDTLKKNTPNTRF